MTAVPATSTDLFRHCPSPNPFTGSSCKRRGCPVCGVGWARSVGTVTERNIEHLNGAVVMISITPPGADQLPWACEKVHRNRHGEVVPCSGKRGCKVDDDAADEWAKFVREEGWKKLRDAARLAVKRAGFETSSLVVQRFWEPQKRGVPHLHVIAGARTPVEYAAANRFAVELARLAPEYRFGFVDRGKREPNQACPVRNHRDRASTWECTCAYALPKISAAEARRYLVSYLTGRQAKKSSIRENISHERMPRSLWWLTPALSSLSTNERIEGMRERLGVPHGTGVTMRRLRYVRWYFAALARRIPVYPRLFGQEMLDVALVCARLEPKKSRAPGESDEACELRHRRNLMTMRRLQEPWNVGAPRGRAPRIDLSRGEAREVERDPWTQLAMDTYAGWKRGDLAAAAA